MAGLELIEIDDYYKMFDLKFPSNKQEITHAYRNLARKYHPDIHVEDEKFAADQFQKINFAYQVLRDSNEKENYDFLYQKYILNTPYLNPESDCFTGCCSTSTVTVAPNSSSRKKVLYSALGFLLMLGLFFRFVLIK